MTNKPTLPSVAKFFAQYAEAGSIFNPRLKVILRNRSQGTIVEVLPENENSSYPIRGGCDYALEGNRYKCGGQDEYDIIAVLDDAGNVIAGEL